MVRIAHVSIVFNFDNMTGVIEKIHDMASSVNDCDFYIFNFNKETDCGNIKYRLIKSSNIMSKVFKYSCILKEVDFLKYPLVVLRYVGSDSSLLKLVETYPQKIVLEHHTKETEELRNRNLPFLFKYGQIFNEYWFLKKTSDYVLGIVGVTDDILSYQRQRHYPKTVSEHLLPNGVNHNRFSPLLNNLKNSEFKLVVVAGIYADWHALDRLLTSLKAYSGTRHIVLDVIGQADSYTKLIQSIDNPYIRINYHGRISRSEMENIISQASAAIDSLGLHRIGFSNSSTLKSRDYVLNCMPMIRSCPDTSLNSINEYIYYAGHDDSNVDFCDVIRWYDNLDFDHIDDKYRTIVFNVLSWRVVFKNLRSHFLSD
ncbi:hypothetical protein ACE1OE_16555 [Vibrio sp. E150_011]